MSNYTEQRTIYFANKNELIFVAQRQYSYNGVDTWEDTYQPFEHLDPNNPTQTIPGHKYMRIRHEGDSQWQLPIRIVGDNPEFRVITRTNEDEQEEQWLQVKLLEQEEKYWEDLIEFNQFKGEKGDQGIAGPAGEGLHIDKFGYFLERPDCCGSQTTSNCNSCNKNAQPTTCQGTFLSLGDGLYEILLADVGKFYSTNGTVWIEIVATDVGKKVRYLANDATGTGSQDYRLLNDLNTRGNVYACADGTWTLLNNISAPTYQVRAGNGDATTGYLEIFVDNSVPTNTDTITLSGSKLNVNDDSLDQNNLKLDTFGDGIDEGTGVEPIKVNPDDLVGKGIKTYTSDTNGEDNFQVALEEIIGNGLEKYTETTVDGEDNSIAQVKPSDIINANSGLQTSTDKGVVEVDSKEDLYVKPSDAISVDTDGVKFEGDELTILADGLTNAKVAETDSNTLGIQAKHLHKNTVNENKGLEKENDTTGSLIVKEDTTRGSIGFNGSGEVHIPDNGVQGVHLNDNTADNAKGLEVSNDKLTAKVDETSIEFNGSGQLAVVEGYIQSLLEAGVASITVNSTTMVGNINTSVSNISPIVELTLTGAGATDGTITYQTNVNSSALTAFIQNVIAGEITTESQYSDMVAILQAGTGITLDPDPVANTITINATASAPSPGSVETLDGTKADGTSNSFAKSDHKHDVADDALTIAKTTGLQTALDAKIPYGTEGNMKLVKDRGLFIQVGSSATFRRLEADANGNLYLNTSETA